MTRGVGERGVQPRVLAWQEVRARAWCGWERPSAAARWGRGIRQRRGERTLCARACGAAGVGRGIGAGAERKREPGQGGNGHAGRPGWVAGSGWKRMGQAGKGELGWAAEEFGLGWVFPILLLLFFFYF